MAKVRAEAPTGLNGVGERQAGRVGVRVESAFSRLGRRRERVGTSGAVGKAGAHAR